MLVRRVVSRYETTSLTDGMVVGYFISVVPPPQVLASDSLGKLLVRARSLSPATVELRLWYHAI